MQLLAGRYRLTREIARGIDATYEAQDEALGRRVAVKRFVAPDSAPEAARERFRRQAVAGAAVSHPGVVRTLDLREADGQLFLVQEYLEGETLDRALERKGALGLSESIRIMSQVLGALDAAGARGIVHRDIKPSNILLTPSGEAKILDFGIAVREGEAVDARAGTPNYMAPEQLRGRPLDRRADVFSASAVLYTLASGRRPFAAETVEEILRRIDYEEPATPTEWPVEVCRVLRRGLAKNASGRYATAGDMLRDLRCVGAGVGAPPETAEDAAAAGLERTARRVERAAWLLGAVCGLLLALAAVLGSRGG